ncbi:DUF6879 family protein [Streptomyces alkaliterrae]|uniref:DUF6879 family protein n=1 Tax=Streptomyces alkaliterrae TaxID=2213162 RepID=UPI002B21B45E|nr:DUF6879 family protein [Streptomyces alkaliterrae]
MKLRFLGIIPNTPVDDSPTIWMDEDTGDLLIQSYRATEDEVKACQEIGSIPGHSTNVPDHETIIRLPRRRAADIPLPGTDLWMFDGESVLFTYFSGVGEVVDRERRTEPEVVQLVASSFELVWERATPHGEYKPVQ